MYDVRLFAYDSGLDGVGTLTKVYTVPMDKIYKITAVYKTDDAMTGAGRTNSRIYYQDASGQLIWELRPDGTGSSALNQITAEIKLQAGDEIYFYYTSGDAAANFGISIIGIEQVDPLKIY